MARLGRCFVSIAGALVVTCIGLAGCADAASTAQRGDVSPTAATAMTTAGQAPTVIPDNEVTPPVATEAVSATAPATSPTPVPTLSRIPTVPPTPADYPDVSYGQPTQLPAISEEEAISDARTASGTLPEMATLPREQFSAIYVLLTDLHYNVTNDLGTPIARAQAVWIVTAHGLTTIPSSSIPGQTPTSAYATHSEMNVIVDTMSGAWVATYAYK